MIRALKRLTPKPSQSIINLSLKGLPPQRGHITLHMKTERNSKKLSNPNHPTKSSKKK